MTFVNEYIPQDDIVRYHIKEIDQRVGLHRRTNSDDWTIDRERDIYLRCVEMGNFEFRHQSAWTFYWHGELIWVELEMLGCSSERNAPGWSRKRIVKLCLMDVESNHLPERLMPQRGEVLKDIEEALLAYKDGGVYSATTTYDLTLEVAEGV